MTASLRIQPIIILFKPCPALRGFKPIAAYDKFLTPSSLVSTIEKLAINDAAPMRLFYAAKSMVDNLAEQTYDISRKASALRGDFKFRGTAPTASTEEEQALFNMIKTGTGKDLLTLSSYRQLEIAAERLQRVNFSKEENGFQTQVFSNELILAFRLLLEDKRAHRRGMVIFRRLRTGQNRRLRKPA